MHYPRPLTSTLQATLAPYSAAVRAPLAARRRRQRALPWTTPPKPPARASCPLGTARAYPQAVGTRSSPPRSPAATEPWSPAILSTAAAGPTSSAYIKRPRAPPSTQATPGHPHSFPLASNRQMVAVFLDSGRFGRRHLPVPFIATRASPTHPTPPPVSPRPHGVAHPLSFDREPP